MQLKNSTDFSDRFLRRMIAWCCRELETKVKTCCWKAVFRNSRSSWGGCARPWRKQITVCIGKSHQFPANCSTHRKGDVFADRLECLVAVTAHELYHVAAEHDPNHKANSRGYGKGSGSSERLTCHYEAKVLDSFRANRESLVAVWSAEPVKVEKPSVQEQRAAKVERQLANWQRKLKLAQTKVKQYKRKAKYYEGVVAAKRQA